MVVLHRKTLAGTENRPSQIYLCNLPDARLITGRKSSLLEPLTEVEETSVSLSYAVTSRCADFLQKYETKKIRGADVLSVEPFLWLLVVEQRQ